MALQPQKFARPVGQCLYHRRPAIPVSSWPPAACPCSHAAPLCTALRQSHAPCRRSQGIHKSTTLEYIHRLCLQLRLQASLRLGPANSRRPSRAQGWLQWRGHEARTLCGGSPHLPRHLNACLRVCEWQAGHAGGWRCCCAVCLVGCWLQQRGPRGVCRGCRPRRQRAGGRQRARLRLRWQLLWCWRRWRRWC